MTWCVRSTAGAWGLGWNYRVCFQNKTCKVQQIYISTYILTNIRLCYFGCFWLTDISSWKSFRTRKHSQPGYEEVPNRGRPEPTTSYQQPTTYQQFGSKTGSGSAITFSGLVPVLAEKCKNVAGFTDKLSVKTAICCWFRLCFCTCC